MVRDVARVKSIFLAAVERYPAEQWPAYLDEACGEDTALRERVEELLGAHGGQKSLDVPAATQSGATGDRLELEQPGTVIGPYKLMEQIGEGGMGVVYVAEQTVPVRRKVALKVIKPGMDTKQVIARFEAERQALAMMDHPNIARIFDGGVTSPLAKGGFGGVAGPTSSWSWSAACPSPSIATGSGSRSGNGWSCSCSSAAPCSTPTRRGSSTAT